VNTFHAVEADGTLTSMVAETIPATAHISGTLASAKGLSAKSVGGKLPEKDHALSKRVSYSGCSSTQQSQTSSAVSAGQRLASAAASYMAANPSGSSLETTWFGTFSSSRASSIQTAYSRLASYPSGWTYNCNTCASDTSTYAYVYPSVSAKVYQKLSHMY
jgi:peptidyl-Lys metalloendopeptidase